MDTAEAPSSRKSPEDLHLAVLTLGEGLVEAPLARWANLQVQSHFFYFSVQQNSCIHYNYSRIHACLITERETIFKREKSVHLRSVWKTASVWRRWVGTWGWHSYNNMRLMHSESIPHGLSSVALQLQRGISDRSAVKIWTFPIGRFTWISQTGVHQ